VISKKRDLPILNNADPAGLLTVAGAKPDVIAGGHADFYGEVGSDTMRVGMFLLQPRAKFTKTSLGVFQRNCPFSGMLGILICRELREYPYQFHIRVKEWNIPCSRH
jgi:hypothetical protein